MGSQRLPGKSMMKISGLSLLNIVINSVSKNPFISKITVATSQENEDDIIEEECSKLNVECFRGDKEDVLSRYISVAKQLKTNDIIVRVTADNPINNIKATQKLFDLHIKNKADYTCIEGLSHIVYEFVNVKALLKLESEKNITAEDKEHVTMYFRKHPEVFNIQEVPVSSLKVDKSLDKLFTIDTREDFDRWKSISQHFDMNKNLEYSLLIKHLKEIVSAQI